MLCSFRPGDLPVTFQFLALRSFRDGAVWLIRASTLPVVSCCSHLVIDPISASCDLWRVTALHSLITFPLWSVIMSSVWFGLIPGSWPGPEQEADGRDWMWGIRGPGSWFPVKDGLFFVVMMMRKRTWTPDLAGCVPYGWTQWTAVTVECAIFLLLLLCFQSHVEPNKAPSRWSKEKRLVSDLVSTLKDKGVLWLVCHSDPEF